MTLSGRVRTWTSQSLFFLAPIFRCIQTAVLRPLSRVFFVKATFSYKVYLSPERNVVIWSLLKSLYYSLLTVFWQSFDSYLIIFWSFHLTHFHCPLLNLASRPRSSILLCPSTTRSDICRQQSFWIHSLQTVSPTVPNSLFDRSQQSCDRCLTVFWQDIISILPNISSPSENWYIYIVI